MTAPRTMAGLLRVRAQQHPEQVAIRFKDGDDWPSWTWGELWLQAQSAARGLHARGIRPGDHVLLLVPEVQEAVRALLGAWTLGCPTSILGLPYRLTDLQAYLDSLRTTARKLESKALVLSRAVASMAEAVAAQGAEGGPAKLLVAEDLAGDHPPVRLEPEEAPGPAFIQLTSGSTGHPRGVVVPHERAMLHMASMSQALPSPEHASAVSWLPLNHDMGLLGGLLFPFFNDFTAHLISPLDFRSRPLVWLEALARFRGTITGAPPSAYAICLQLAGRALERQLDLSACEVAMIGAEPVSPALLRRFSEAFAPCGFRERAFYPVYGLAEATVAVTFPRKLDPVKVDRIDRGALEREGRAAPAVEGQPALELTGLGAPIPHTELRVVDEAMQPLEDRREGEVLVRSATMMKEYHGEPEVTAAAFHEGWLRTGDLGYRADGHLFITGRKKDLIIKGGHNLSPPVLEEIALQVQGVRPGGAAAVGVWSAERQTELAYLVVETKLEGQERAALGERIRERLKANGIAIDQVRLVAPGTLPKTTSGKLQRRAIAAAIAEGKLAFDGPRAAGGEG